MSVFDLRLGWDTKQQKIFTKNSISVFTCHKFSFGWCMGRAILVTTILFTMQIIFTQIHIHSKLTIKHSSIDLPPSEKNPFPHLLLNNFSVELINFSWQNVFLPFMISDVDIIKWNFKIKLRLKHGIWEEMLLNSDVPN